MEGLVGEEESEKDLLVEDVQKQLPLAVSRLFT